MRTNTCEQSVSIPITLRCQWGLSLHSLRIFAEAKASRSTIQQIVFEHRRRYGYRRVTAELRRRGMVVNHKRVSRLMREDNLLAVQPRAFVVTTDSKHEFEMY